MNKKVLFIGDIHGLPQWREIALDALKKFQEVVFLGDYLDSFNISPALQLENLKSIIAFLRNKPNHGKITALLGNHDYAYIKSFSAISGYQHNQAFIYKELLEKNIDLFSIAWGYTSDTGKYTLATHAGLTHKFWNYNILPLFNKWMFLDMISDGNGPSSLQIHEILNYLIDKSDLMWKVGSMRGGVGTPGPLWADYIELLSDPYPDINQVFGHTAKQSISMDFIKDSFYACIDTYGDKLGTMTISL